MPKDKSTLPPPERTITLTQAQFDILAIHLTCRIDDFEREIKSSERKTGKQATNARKQHAMLCRMKAEHFMITPLEGEWHLLDGTVIPPQVKPGHKRS